VLVVMEILNPRVFIAVWANQTGVGADAFPGQSPQDADLQVATAGLYQQLLCSSQASHVRIEYTQKTRGRGLDSVAAQSQNPLTCGSDPAIKLQDRVGLHDGP